jgi:predicted outer membrane protein
MRKVFAGLIVAFCAGGVAFGQAVQNPPAQPVQPGRVVGQPAQPGAVQPGRAVQPVQPVQPGRVVERQPLQPGQALPAGQAASGDQQIAACVYGHCRNEIEIAKLAQTKSQNEEVREFAEKMISEHTPGCQEMQRLAGQLASDTREQQPQRGAAGGQLDWVSIHKEIGQQCLNSVKKELSSKQGNDFDKCFMGQQIGAHMMVVDALKVLQNHASSELQPKLDKELQVAQQHLTLAKQIEQKLKDLPSERVSRRPEGKQ